MKPYLIFDSEGRLRRQGVAQIDFPPTDGGTLVEVDSLIDLSVFTARLVNNEIIIDPVREVPAQPSQFHKFDEAAWQWVLPIDGAWELVRLQRNQLLQQSDWTQLPDVPIATKEAWAAYRQQLRDVTNQPDPFNIVWPTAPN